ncbi:MAG TPA: isoprenylcysteine carboxylmethyltransferase family protein [Ktedonobacteraceae bacterium]|jgi:protein-S-isoprenylcysteine O-methyltransferase Ste14
MLLYTNMTYTLLFVVIFLSWAMSELLGPVRWSHTTQGKGKRRDRRSLLLGGVSGGAGVIFALASPFLLLAANIPPAPFFFVGIACVALGVGWRWYAILTLGRYFTAEVIIQERQTVVSSGPYLYVRHPSYTGVLVIVAGLGLMIGNWASVLVIVAGLFFPLLYRMSIEEHEMSEAFEEYAQYMRRTRWRLIPFVF